MSLTEEQIKALKQVFTEFDKDNSGTITKEELVQAFKGLDLADEIANKMMEEMDLNQDGKISYQEFLEVSSRGLKGT